MSRKKSVHVAAPAQPGAVFMTVQESHMLTQKQLQALHTVLYRIPLDAYKTILVVLFGGSTLTKEKHTAIGAFFQSFAVCFRDACAPSDVCRLPRLHNPAPLLRLLKEFGLWDALDATSHCYKYLTTSVVSLYFEYFYFHECVSMYAQVAKDRASVRDVKSLMEDSTRLADFSVMAKGVFGVVDDGWDDIQKHLESFQSAPLHIKSAPNSNAAAPVKTTKSKKKAASPPKKKAAAPAAAPPTTTTTTPISVPIAVGEKDLLEIMWKYHVTKHVKTVTSMTPNLAKLILLFGQEPMPWEDVPGLLPTVLGKVSPEGARLLGRGNTKGHPLCTPTLFLELVDNIGNLFDTWFSYEIYSADFPLAQMGTLVARRVPTSIALLESLAHSCGLPPSLGISPDDLLYLFPPDDGQIFLTAGDLLESISLVRTASASYARACETNSLFPLLCFTPSFSDPDECIPHMSSTTFCELFHIDSKIPVDHALTFRKYFLIAVFLRLTPSAVFGLRKTSSLNALVAAQKFTKMTAEVVLTFLFSLLPDLPPPSAVRYECLVDSICFLTGIKSSTADVVSPLQVEKIVHFLSQLTQKMSRLIFTRFVASHKVITSMLEGKNNSLHPSDIHKLIALSHPNTIPEDAWQTVVAAEGVMESWLGHLSHPYPRNTHFTSLPGYNIAMCILSVSSAKLHFSAAPRHSNIVEHLKKSTTRMNYYATKLDLFQQEHFSNTTVVPVNVLMAFLRSSSISCSRREAVTAFVWWYTHDCETLRPETVSFVTCETIVSKLVSLFDDVVACCEEGSIEPSPIGALWDYRCDTMPEDAELWVRVLHRVQCPVIHIMLRVIPVPTNIADAIHWFVVSTAVNDVGNENYGMLKWLLALHDITTLGVPDNSPIPLRPRQRSRSLVNGTPGSIRYEDKVFADIKTAQRGMQCNPWSAVMTTLYTSYLGDDFLGEITFKKYDSQEYDVQIKDFKFVGEVAEDVFVKMCADVSQQPLLTLNAIRPLIAMGEFHMMALYRPGWEGLLMATTDPTTYETKRYTLAVFRLIFPTLMLSREMSVSDMGEFFPVEFEKYKESVLTK